MFPVDIFLFFFHWLSLFSLANFLSLSKFFVIVSVCIHCPSLVLSKYFHWLNLLSATNLSFQFNVIVQPSCQCLVCCHFPSFVSLKLVFHWLSFFFFFFYNLLSLSNFVLVVWVFSFVSVQVRCHCPSLFSFSEPNTKTTESKFAHYKNIVIILNLILT